MRQTPRYLMTDPDEVKRLIRKHPWATFVSATSTGLVSSHYPALLDDSSDDIAVYSHVGRPDDELHELGQHQILVIVVLAGQPGAALRRRLHEQKTRFCFCAPWVSQRPLLPLTGRCASRLRRLPSPPPRPARCRRLSMRATHTARRS